jgi:hypothetical protein
LRNFAVDICGAQTSWIMRDFIHKEIVRIRHLVGDHAQVIGGVSGGVDSTVAAKLMKEAIGDRFHAILVDNGLMRLNECKDVKKTLEEHLGINLTVVDGAELFISRLKGVADPEKKRKIIGGTCMFASLSPCGTLIAGYLDVLIRKQLSIFFKEKRLGSNRKPRIHQTQVRSFGSYKAQYAPFSFIWIILTLNHTALPRRVRSV